MIETTFQISDPLRLRRNILAPRCIMIIYIAKTIYLLLQKKCVYNIDNITKTTQKVITKRMRSAVNFKCHL